MNLETPESVAERLVACLGHGITTVGGGMRVVHALQGRHIVAAIRARDYQFAQLLVAKAEEREAERSSGVDMSIAAAFRRLATEIQVSCEGGK